MSISPTTPPEVTRPRGLENAIQRVQAAIARRADRAGPARAGDHVPGANALARLHANAQRHVAPAPEPQPLPPTPAPVEPPSVSPIGPGLDLIA